MIISYTETFETFLENQKYGTEEQSSALTSVLALMDKFPNFVFETNLNVSMWDLFKTKFDLREIGAETEELFMHYWTETAMRLEIKYIPLIQKWLDDFNDLDKLTVKLSKSDSGVNTNSNSNQNTYYLNPVNATTGVEKTVTRDENGNLTATFTGGNLKVQDLDASDGNSQSNYSRTGSRDALISLWGKTRAQVLDQILKLENIYLQCLTEFEVLFMGVY